MEGQRRCEGIRVELIVRGEALGFVNDEHYITSHHLTSHHMHSHTQHTTPHYIHNTWHHSPNSPFCYVPWIACVVLVYVLCVFCVFCVCVVCVVCCVVLCLHRSRVGFCGLCLPCGLCCLWSCVASSSVSSSFLSSLSSCRCCVVSLCSVRHALFGAHTSTW